MVLNLLKSKVCFQLGEKEEENKGREERIEHWIKGEEKGGELTKEKTEKRLVREKVW